MSPAPSARRVSTPTELAFSCMYGLQPSLAAILASMFSGATINTLRTHIHRLRVALPEESIDRDETGYFLTEVGRTECEQSIMDFRAWVTEQERAA